MKIQNKAVIAASIAMLLGLTESNATYAATVVNLGTADSFAVLGGSAITNTGSSIINGNMGLSPGTAVTGFPPGTLNGTQEIANANAVQAQADVATAYAVAVGQVPVSTVSTELGGTTKAGGTYVSAAGTFGLTGTLTLDAEGDPNAVFIFKTNSTLITASASAVALINGAQACNVYWQVGSSATLGANTLFKGNILALTSVTLITGANVEGRVIARNGAITFDTNTITKATCSVTVPAPVPVPTPIPALTTSTPTPTQVVVVPTSTPDPVVVPVVVVSTSTPTPPTPVAIPVVQAPVVKEPTSEIAPIVTPRLPNTGIAPDEERIAWGALASIGIVIVTSASYMVARKQIK